MVILLFQCDGWKTTRGVFADAYTVIFDNQVRGFLLTIAINPENLQALQCIANVVDDNLILIKASDLQDNFLDLTDLNLLPIWNSESYVS